MEEASRMSMTLHLQNVPAKNGALWLRHGFKVLQRRPLALAGLYLLTLIVGVLLPMVLPFLGALSLMILPLVSLGFMLATHLILQDKTPTPAVFLAPLKLTPERRRNQLKLCLAYGIAMTLAMLLAQWIDGGAFAALQALLAAEKPDQAAIAEALAQPQLFWGFAVMALAFAIVSVAFWHAPALVHWGGQGAMQAVFSSTLAIWRNKSAFAYNALCWLLLLVGVAMLISTVFGLLGLPAQLMMLALLSAGLMLSTAFYASLYFSFVDCFMFGAPRDLLSEKKH